MRAQLLLSLITSAIFFQTLAFTVDKSVLKCETDGTTKQFARGDTAIICLHFLNDVQNLRMAYSVTVDEYAAITVTGAHGTFLGDTYKNFSTGIAMQASTTESTSTGIFYIKQVTQNNTNPDGSWSLTFTSTTVYTVYSAVIEVDKGIIKSVYWDNSCYMCSSSSCDTNYYATDSSVSANCFDSTCSTNNGNYTCDPKVYVSWIGTDANGLKMESAGLRISMFRQYSIGDLYASAQKIIADQYNSTTKTYDCKVAGTCT